jgi:hypothetical protein
VSSAVEFLAADPRRIRIAFVETIAVNGHGDHRRAFLALGEEEVLSVIPQLSGRRSLTPAEVRLKAIAFVGAGNELLIALADGRLQEDPGVIADFITDLWLAGVAIPRRKSAKGRSRGSPVGS